VCFELREHGVEAVGEFTELVLTASNSIRWASDPFVAMRVASAIRDRGASIRPARIHPPSRPNTNRKTSTAPAAGAKLRARPARVSTPPGPALTSGTSASRYHHTAASSKAPASMRNPA
jgi:hypothetical protein